MSLHVYNTRTRRKEAFVPLDAAHLRMYVCGPTVYDYAHVGNARPFVVFDVLYRLLQQLYPDARVTYVRNITDIEDKIIARAQARGESIAQVTERTTEAFHEDMAALNVLPPDVEPRATGHIPEMVEMIGTLIGQGHAYEADGHVLFDTASWTEYGRFANVSADELEAGARVEVAPYKRNPTDFVLWKPSDAGQPGWDSPWGKGRPGWHIECSAMAKKHLGETFDIHGGGQDLIFPHHQNEIAQSCCANGTEILARYWMHNGFLIVEGEKMSKSLGNFLTIREALAQWPGEVLRFALLATHYRQPLDLTEAGLRQARTVLDRWYRLTGDLEDDGGDPPAAFLEALSDDLNTPKAFAVLHALADAGRPDDLANIKRSNRLLGLAQKSVEEWFRGGEADSARIEDLIQRRVAARKARDFGEADRIRDGLAAEGIVLEDGPGGTTWRRAG